MLSLHDLENFIFKFQVKTTFYRIITHILSPNLMNIE